MKKLIIFVLAVLCVFSLAACNKNDKQSLDYKEITADEIAAYDNYKITMNIKQSSQGMRDISLYCGKSIEKELNASSTTEMFASNYKDKQNMLAKSNEMGINICETFDLVEFLETSGFTLDAFKERAEAMVKSAKDPKAVVIDEANGKVSFNVNMSELLGNSDAYTIYDADLKQYKVLNVTDGKITSGKYQNRVTDDGLFGDVDLLSMKPLLAEVISKGTFDKGVYTYIPTGKDAEGGKIVLDIEEVTSLTLSTVGGNVKFGLIGKSGEGSVEISVELSDINKTSFDVPKGEVPCVSEHQYTKMQAFETGHRKVCYECGKCMDLTVKEHNIDDETKICLDCHNMREFDEYAPDFMYSNSLNHSLLDLYSPAGSDMVYANSNMNLYYKYNYSETKPNGLYAHYYYDDGILILTELGEEKKPSEDYCFTTQKIDYTLLSVKLTLTDEQKEAVKTKDQTAAEIFEQALDLPDTAEEIKAKYTDVIKAFTAYSVYESHDYEATTETNGCAEISVAICKKCGKVVRFDIEYHHDKPVTYIDKPAWGTDGSVYFTLGECTKCHEPADGYIYEIEANRLKDHAGKWSRAIYYKADGTRVGSVYMPTPHKVSDGVCEMCGKHNLVVGNVSVFVDKSTWNVDIVGGYDRSNYVGAEDEYTVYEYSRGEEAICKVGYKYSSDNTKIDWILIVGEESATTTVDAN